MDVTRRNFVTSAAAMSLAAALGGTASAAQSTEAPLFNLTDKPLGLQLGLLGGEVGPDPEMLFSTISKLGYRNVEGGLEDFSDPKYRAAAARHGVALNSVLIDPGVMLAGGEADLARLADRMAAAGVPFGGVPIFPFPPEKFTGPGDPGEIMSRISDSMTVDDWKKVADMMNHGGAGLKKGGATIFYHAHNNEFRPLNDTTPFDILMKNTDPDLVTFEMDIGWVAAAGVDPLDLFARHSGRFRLMHVKDLSAETKPNFNFGMVPKVAGQGSLDWPTLIPAARKAGITEFFVEQEPPFSTTRLEAARLNAQYLLNARG